MNPAVLVSDIGNFKKIGIKAGSFQGFLIQFFMSLGSTRRNNYSVQLILDNLFSDFILSYLWTGEDIVVHHDHCWQGPGESGQGLHIHHFGDIASTGADKDSYPGFLHGNIHFHREHLFLHHGSSGLNQFHGGRVGHACGISDGLTDIAGRNNAAC